MAIQTSLVAQQVRLQQWAEQIRDCQSRPKGMDVETWCAQNNLTKANYYYRLRRVREVCLEQVQGTAATAFVELPVPTTASTELIIPGLFEPPVRILRATIPENESHIFR